MFHLGEILFVHVPISVKIEPLDALVAYFPERFVKRPFPQMGAWKRALLLAIQFLLKNLINLLRTKPFQSEKVESAGN